MDNNSLKILLFQIYAMGSAQLASLSVHIKGSSGIGGGGSIGGGGDIEVAVIFAEPTAQELDYLFGNKNLTRYVLQLISNSGFLPAVRQVLPDSTGTASLFSGEENGFLDSLDYISHLKAELAAGGNLDIAAVKDEIKIEDIPEALLAPASLPTTTNGAVVSAEDDRRDDSIEEDDYIDEDFVIPDSDRSDHEDNRKRRRTRTRRLTRGREAKRSVARLKERAAGSDTEQEGEEGGMQADKKIWPYVKVMNSTGFGVCTYYVL
jgi:hypothetical protein